MLSVEEQADLYRVYASALGEDAQVKAVESRFNEDTLDAVEAAVSAAAQCNANMAKLLGNLLGGGSVFAKGWLKKGLKRIGKRLRDDQVKLNGYGCMVATKAKWREAIIMSTI